jgi:signal transduction histidine kinase
MTAAPRRAYIRYVPAAFLKIVPTVARSDRTTEDLFGELPPWVGWCEMVPVGAILTLQLAQGGYTVPTAVWAVAAAAVLVPWLLDSLRLYLPALLFAPLAAAPIVVLGHHHASAAAWFLLVFLVGRTATVAGWRVSLAVLIAAEAILLGEALTVRALTVTVAGATVQPYVIGDWTGWFLGMLAGAVTGWVWRSQRRALLELRAAQGDLARQAALGERQRIAREIHDVIAHSLTVTMLHLTGARLALGSGDPAEAEEALQEAERVGRQSLADIRRTVDVLSPNGSEAGAPPLPGAGDIAALVRGYADAGVDVGLVVEGDLSGITPATGLGLYRIVQESLANAVKHAPGAPVEVHLAVDAQHIGVRVRNRDGATPATQSASGGQGVAGMRERATLLGGRLEAGPDGDGWLVDVEVPLVATGEVVPRRDPRRAAHCW